MYRLVGLPASYSDSLSELGLSGTDIAEALELLPEFSPEELLTKKFERGRYGEFGFGDPTRYSDGSFPVLYTAREPETARAEVAHHIKNQAVKDGSLPVCQFRVQFATDVSGTTKDLVPTGWRELVDEDYSVCQELGREAVNSPLATLGAPSARRAGGTCVPVFEASAATGLTKFVRVKIEVSDDGAISTKEA